MKVFIIFSIFFELSKHTNRTRETPYIRSRGYSRVGSEAILRAGRSRVRISLRKIYIFFLVPSDRLWSPSSLLLSMHGGTFPGIKRPGRDSDHSPPFSTEVKQQLSYTSTPPYVVHLHGAGRKNFTFIVLQPRYRRSSNLLYVLCNKGLKTSRKQQI